LFSDPHKTHTRTLCGQNVELLNVKLAVHIVTTGFLKPNEFELHKHTPQRMRNKGPRRIWADLSVVPSSGTGHSHCDVSGYQWPLVTSVQLIYLF